jgi:hypothetical protein
MKNFVLSLAATAAALVIGCQSPDVNNPVAIDEGAHSGTTAKPAPTPAPLQIGFDQKISYTDPGVSGEFLEATGNVVYQITRVVPGSENVYDVLITVRGGISPVPSDGSDATIVPWIFGGSTKDRISIPSGKKVVLTKMFVVTGANVPSILNMPVTVSDQQLAVGSMSLVKIIPANADAR